MATMDTLRELTNKYKSEAEDAFDKLKASSATLQDDLQAKVQSTLQQLQPLIDQSKEELISSVQDQSPSVDINMKRMVETYMWTGVLLVSLTIGGLLGGVILPGIIGLFVSSFYAAVIAYGVLPAVAIYYLRQPLEVNAENDMKCRHRLLLFSIVEGVLHGFLFSQRVLSGPPPLAAITPLAIAISSPLTAERIGNDRMKLLGVTLGSGIAAHLIVGVPIGLSFPYFLLTILYAGIAFVSLQYFLKNEKQSAFTSMYQLSFVMAVVVSHILIYTLFGGSPEDMQSNQSE